MNGVHDMGGMTGFGPVVIERDEPVFHADWERRLFGIVRLTIDERYNWDEFRSAIERLTPLEYLSATYYERWLSALERYLVEKGDILETELRQESGGRSAQIRQSPAGPGRINLRGLRWDGVQISTRRSSLCSQPQPLGPHAPAPLCSRTDGHDR